MNIILDFPKNLTSLAFRIHNIVWKISGPTATPMYMNKVVSANAVEAVNIRLLEMEQYWVETQSGPFPKNI